MRLIRWIAYQIGNGVIVALMLGTAILLSGLWALILEPSGQWLNRHTWTKAIFVILTVIYCLLARMR